MPRRANRYRQVRHALALPLCLALAGCDKTQEPVPATATSLPAGTAAAAAQAPLAPTPPTANAGGEASDEGNDLCAKVIVVVHAESTMGKQGVKRSSDIAKTHAETLRAEVEGGADFIEVATRSSEEERSVKKRAGLGTFPANEFPERYVGLAAPLLRVGVGELTPVVSIPLGWAFAKRCAVDKVHTRHLLVRYAGAERAPAEVTRTKAEAKARAQQAHDKITRGADFAEIAAEYGEDGSAAKGGDLGPIGRGMFVTAFEDAAWALEPGALAPVVEGPFGFHVVRREK